MMKIDFTDLNTYDYNLPEELIAQQPLEKRDASKLLIYNCEKDIIEHKHFYNITDYVGKGDLLVLNNTRVLPARIFGSKLSGGRIECLLLKRKSLKSWEVLLKPAKRLKVGERLFFSYELSAILVDILEDGNRILEFDYSGVFEEILEKIGQMPLPPYIHEKLEDKERYQTIYNQVTGSAAAPTAGLHFTQELLTKLKEKGAEIVYVTLDVGLGTFRPCKENDITKHVMHNEHFTFSKENAEQINKAIVENKRIIAVGTTSVRVLETVANKSFPLKAFSGETNIFIYPPYEFKVVDALITNFHLPKSTLLMLISAFAGVENVKKVYESAIENKYRFFSFGDACFFY